MKQKLLFVGTLLAASHLFGSNAIQIRKLVEQSYLVGTVEPGAPTSEKNPTLISSPTGDWIAAVAKEGSLREDIVYCDLVLYQITVNDRKRSLTERYRVRRSGNKSPISRVRWEGDGSAVLFAGADEGGVMQAFRVRLIDGVTQQLTFSTGENDAKYFEYKAGTVLVRSGTVVQSARDLYPVVAGTRLRGGALVANEPLPTVNAFLQIWRSRSCRVMDGIFAAEGPLLISNDGAKFLGIRLCNSRSDEAFLVLVSAQTNEETVLGSAKLEMFRSTPVRYTWASDDSRVYFAGVAPASFAVGSKWSTQDLIAFDVRTAQWEVVQQAAMRIRTIVPECDDTLVCRYEDGTQKRFGVVAGRWSELETVTQSSLQSDLIAVEPRSIRFSWGRVWIEEDAFEAPRVQLSESAEVGLSPKQRPQGAGFIEHRVIEWDEGPQLKGKGGLIVSSHVGPRAPVVIQVVNPGLSAEFRPSDDAFSKSYLAGCYLASLGYVVLRVDRTEIGANEGAAFVNRLESAILALAREVDVDRSRIGALGHSRTGYQVLFAAMKLEKARLAAAVLDDSINGSLSHTLLAAGATPAENYRDLLAGFPLPRPFWEAPRTWLENDVVFNINRIQTPLLISLHVTPPWFKEGKGPNFKGQLHTLDVIGALNLNSKSFECIWFPDADHVLGRPKQQEALAQWIVEWLNFWLKSESPVDADRAARWAILRKRQDEVLKTPPPPKGKWVFQLDAEQPAWAPPTEPSAAGPGASTETESKTIPSPTEGKKN